MNLWRGKENISITSPREYIIRIRLIFKRYEDTLLGFMCFFLNPILVTSCVSRFSKGNDKWPSFAGLQK